jgi:hypothetical protein
MEFLKSYKEFNAKESAFVLKVDRIKDVKPDRFKNGKYLNFFIRIFLDIDEKSGNNRENIYSINDVSFVRYELDPSYRDPYRISESPQNNFELRVWTYGFYPFKATVYLKFGATVALNGFVHFDVSEQEKAQNRGEVA